MGEYKLVQLWIECKSGCAGSFPQCEDEDGGGTVQAVPCGTQFFAWLEYRLDQCVVWFVGACVFSSSYNHIINPIIIVVVVVAIVLLLVVVVVGFEYSEDSSGANSRIGIATSIQRIE